MTKHIKLVSLILNILRMEEREFIYALYKQVLYREPSNAEYLAKRNNLKSQQKIDVLAEMVQSKEAINIYKNKTQVLTMEKETTITNIIIKGLKLNNSNYISFLYEQLLNRKPEQQELNSHLSFVKRDSLGFNY